MKTLGPTKTPLKMIEDVAAEICESASLLEIIYRNYELPPEADSAIGCLIRSLYKTLDTANEYAETLVSKN